MATGSDAPGAKPRGPMGKDEAETPIRERVSASKDDALFDAFDEAEGVIEEVDIELSKSKARSGEVDLRPSAEVIEPDEPPPIVSVPPVSMSDPRIGETLNGRYKLEKLIGKGGMGRVYRAMQFPLNRP